MKTYKFKINGKEYQVDIESVGDEFADVKCNGVSYKVEFELPDQPKKTPTLARKAVVPQVSEKRTHSPAESAAANVIKAPIPGLITAIVVSEGDKVESGQLVAKMEAMKMENNILAASDGIISRIAIKVGDTVLEGDVLMSMEDA
ncbi:MAG: biotin/lipoyl-binding protein [Candidatus Marinimicrobia bacterium]|nr:biotin/lipoyl-binding protein [Candidatus Neomarinimicrobiota bacterium]